MIFKKFYLLILITLLSCSSTNNELIGVYKSYKPTYMDKIFRYFKYDRWSSGTVLELKKDSTFEMNNCSMQMKGKWTSKSDSLFLKIEYKKFLIDSLNYNPKWKNWLVIGKGLYGYKINGGFLKNVKKSIDGKKSLEMLQKVN